MTGYLFDQIMDFTRTSSGTYVDSAGLIQSTPISKNILLYTQEFNNTSWAKLSCNACPFDPATAVLGPELVVNGNFSNGTYGWIPTGVVSYTVASGQITVSGNNARVNSARFATIPGATYLLTFNAVSTTGASWINVRRGDTSASLYSYQIQLGTGIKSVSFVAVSATTYVSIDNGASGSPVAVWDDISVKQMSGSVFYSAPDGTKTADIVRLNVGSTVLTSSSGLFTGGTGVYFSQGTAAALATGSHTASMYVKAAAGISHVQLRVSLATSLSPAVATDTASILVRLSDGAIIANPSGLGTVTSVGNGWYRVTMTFTAVASVHYVGCWFWNDSSIANATGNEGILVWGAQLEAGSQATSYAKNAGGRYPPRFDYNPTTLAPRGLLIEEQRTNLLTYSEQFNNAAWISGSLSVSLASGTSPNGTNTANKLIEDTTAGAVHSTRQGITLAATGTTAVFTVFAKAAGRSWMGMWQNGGGAGWPDNTQRVSFDLQNGVIGTVGTGWTASMTAVGNGWYRCSISAAGGTNSFQATIGIQSANNTIAYTGDGTSGILVWGAQLESGAIPTSYIPTVASTVTRTADICTISGSFINESYKQSEGTVLVDLDTITNYALKTSIAFNDTTSRNVMSINANSITPVFRVITDGQTQVESTTGIVPNINDTRMLLAYKVNNFIGQAAQSTGLAVDSQGSVTSVSSIGIGSNNAGSFVNGHIKSVKYYPRQLTTSEIQALIPVTPVSWGNDFVMKIETTAANETFTIPCQNVGTFNATVNWGDGTANSTITTYNDTDLVHTYVTPGIYTIRISGTFPNINFNNGGDRLKVRTVEQLGIVGWTRLQSAFDGCARMTKFIAGNCNTSAVPSAAYMFRNCSALSVAEVGNLNTSNITTFQEMFSGCATLTKLDVGSWNTGNANAFSSMFSACSALTELDVSNWNTANVTGMAGMFNQCTSITSLNVSNWNTAKVTTFDSMFYGCAALNYLPVNNWNTGLVISMFRMFRGCTSLTSLNLSSWNTANVTTLQETFLTCTSLLSLDVSTWNTGAVTSMNNTFGSCFSLTTLNVANWNTANVTIFANMFDTCAGLSTVSVGTWNTAKATNMASMFRSCSSLTTLNVTNWNTSLVTTMADMFSGCTVLGTVDISPWNIGSLVSATNFMTNANTALVTGEYDQTLIAWASGTQGTPKTGVTITFGTVKYTAGGAAQAARNTLTTTYTWTINDGGPL